MKDYHRVLDLPQDASQKQIKDRYRQLVRIFHPDRYRNAEDRRYAEQKLQTINEAYDAIRGGRPRPVLARGFRLTTDRQLPRPVVYPARINLGSVVHGEKAYALLQIDNVGGFAHALSFHPEKGVDWFAITKGERMFPHKPLPMLLHIEARTASLEIGQEVESWLDIDVNGIKARATLSMKVVDHSSATVGPGRAAAFVGAAVALLIAVYTVWSLMGSVSADGATVTGSTSSFEEATMEETTAAPNDGLPVAVLPPSAVVTDTQAVEATSEMTIEGDTGAASAESQTLDMQSSNGGVLKPVNLMPPAKDDPPIEHGANGASTEVEETDTEPTPTASADPEAQNDADSSDRISFASQAKTAQTEEFSLADDSSSTFVPSVPALPTLVPIITALPTSMPSTDVATAEPTATAAPPTPTIPTVTIRVPQAYQINARASTSTESESLALLDKGATYPAIARTVDNAWTQIILPDDRAGWVYTASMEAVLMQIETLPVSAELLDVESN